MANQRPDSKIDPRGIFSREAEAAIPAFRILKRGSDEEKLTLASADTDKLLGVSIQGQGDDLSDMLAAGQMCDFATQGVAPVEYGGSVNDGDFLTADSDGKAVATTTQGKATIGRAVHDGVAGDIGAVALNVGVL